jgi:TolB-like protein/DNA-binding winged helix-turn-helix (wHTH) protein/tetratricopeptide (TPR) repeat protein
VDEVIQLTIMALRSFPCAKLIPLPEPSLENPQPMRGTYRFGVFEADIEAGELRKQGIRIKLQEQPFQVLLALVEKPGQVIPREELQKKIWPAETFVDFDHGVNNAVRRLREALGDSAENPRFIETLSRRGYRFIAPVTASNGGIKAHDISDVPPAEKTRLRLPRWAIAVCAVVMAAAAFLAARAFRVRDRAQAASPPQILSLAVLPFTNLSGDPAREYFSDGMTDALITDLAQISSVKVISRTSTIRYKKTDRPLPEIGRELNVDGIIEGTVQRSGDRVRITAQLIHAPEDKHLWANSYDRDVRDVFMLEREVTDDIANQVREQIATHGQSSVQPRALDRNALDAYLQGRHHLHMSEQGPRDEELWKAAQFFQQAIDAAPDFAPAYIGLAEAHYTRFWGSNEDFNVMRASTEKALELDPGSSDAHCEMALVKLTDFDWAGAEEESRRAVSLNPNNALAHEQLGFSLSSLRRLEEARKEGEIAQQLDPNQDHLSYSLYLLGEYDRSVEHLQRIVAARPDDAVTRWFLSRVYARQGKYAESVRETGKAMTLSGLPEIAPRLDRAFATAGWPGALRQWARELEQLMVSRQAYFPAVLSDVYMQLGEKDKALYWLEEASKHRYVATSDPVLGAVNVDPVFAPLHSDPRFKVVLQRMHLQE